MSKSGMKFLYNTIVGIFPILCMSLLTSCVSNAEKLDDHTTNTSDQHTHQTSAMPWQAKIIHSYKNSEKIQRTQNGMISSFCTSSAMTNVIEEIQIFYDYDPSEEMIVYRSQYCWKDQFKVEVDGKTVNAMKVRCRQPNGFFCYLK